MQIINSDFNHKRNICGTILNRQFKNINPRQISTNVTKLTQVSTWIKERSLVNRKFFFNRKINRNINKYYSVNLNAKRIVLWSSIRSRKGGKEKIKKRRILNSLIRETSRTIHIWLWDWGIKNESIITSNIINIECLSHLTRWELISPDTKRYSYMDA